MLLTIHNLPAATRYADIKSLLQSKCGIQQVILDNLVSEGNSKKVTVGVAEDADAAILTRKINGLFWNGQQLYVEDVRQQKAASDQPYRSLNPQPELKADPSFSSMNLVQNSSYDMVAAQQMMPMYYMPIPAYPDIEAYRANVMETVPGFRQEKVQSAYPGISGFAQNASVAPQYTEPQFDSQQDYAQPAKRSRWGDDLNSANEKSLYGQRFDQTRASPPRESRDSRKVAWQVDDGSIQDLKVNVRPTQPDYRSNVGPTRPDFRSNVRPTEPDFRSTIRPEERSDFVRPGLLDKPRRELESSIQRRENERQGRLDEREIFSRRPNEDKFSRKPNDEFSRRPNDEFSRRPNDEFSRRPNDEFSRRSNDEFSRRPNDEFSRRPNDEFSRRPNDEFSGRPNNEFSRKPNDEFSRKPINDFTRRPNEGAEFSRRTNVPGLLNERQGTGQFSGRPSGREEPFRRPNEEFSRRPNDRVDYPRRPNERSEFSRRPNERAESSRRPNVPNHSNERERMNQFSGKPNEFSERQGKPSRFNQPNFNRNNSNFDPNTRPDVSNQPRGYEQRSIPDSRKRKFEEFKPKSSQQAFVPPKPFRAHIPYQPFAVPPLTEQSKEKLNKRMRISGTNKILHDIYSNSLSHVDPDQITRKMFRQVVMEQLNPILGDKKMVTSLEIHEIYRAKYPPSEDETTYKVVVERMSQNVADQEKGENTEVKTVLAPPPAAAPSQIAAAPTCPPTPKAPTKSQKRAKKKLQEAKQLISQGKLPTFPLGNKSVVAEHRKQEKQGIIPETDHATSAALTDEVDALLQFCTDELVNPPEETSREIYKSVCPEEFIGDFKTIITQRLARRVTDSGLKVVRVYGRPNLPKREVLEKFLIKYGVQSLRKSNKAKLFTAAVDTYKNFDKLCNATFTAPDGNIVHFKAFQVAPKQRADQTLLRKLRKQNLSHMIDRSELNLLDKDWPAKEEEIKAREAEKKAKMAAEWAADEERKALEVSQAENATAKPGNENTENVVDLTDTIVNENVIEVDQTNTVNESNDYLHDDFHVIDEVNENDSDLECLDDTANQVFYIDEDIGNVVTNTESVNNGYDNTVENNGDENDVVECTNDNNDENDVVECTNDNNDGNIEDENEKIDEEIENNDGENDAYNEDDVNEDNTLDGDDDFEMGDVDIDNVDLDLGEIDDGDLEDY